MDECNSEDEDESDVEQPEGLTPMCEDDGSARSLQSCGQACMSASTCCCGVIPCARGP